MGGELGPRPGHRDGVRGPDSVIPGIRNGSLFVGVQPMRSAPERAEELYHSTDSTPPHSYLAFYRWVDEVFGADVVLPRGHPRHPGVATGQGDRPVLRLLRRHLHRRGAPPLHLQHQHPGGGDAGQAPLLRLHTRPPDPLHGRRGHLRRPHRFWTRPSTATITPARPGLPRRPHCWSGIFTLAEELEVTADLQMGAGAIWEAEPEDGVARLHRWMSRIKTSLVRDGLHIYGQPPEGERFDHLARALVRVPNGAVPALEDSILLAQGWAPEELRAAPERLYPDGRTALRIVDGAIATARRLFARLSAEGYRPEAAAELLGGGGLSGGHHPAGAGAGLCLHPGGAPAAPNHGRAGSAAGGGGGALCPALARRQSLPGECPHPAHGPELLRHRPRRRTQPGGMDGGTGAGGAGGRRLPGPEGGTLAGECSDCGLLRRVHENQRRGHRRGVRPDGGAPPLSGPDGQGGGGGAHPPGGAGPPPHRRGAAHQRPVPGHLPQRGGAGGAGGAGRGRPG